MRDALGVRVLALWGMTENGGVTFQKYVLQDQLRGLRARGQ